MKRGFFDKAYDGRENHRWVAARNRLVCKFLDSDPFMPRSEALRKANEEMTRKEKESRLKRKRR